MKDSARYIKIVEWSEDPWRDEYEAVLGRTPKHVTLAGGDIDDRHNKYLVDAHSVRDLYLTTFQTLHRDWQEVTTLFSHQGVRFYLVIDEAHYIKQLDGERVRDHAAPVPRTFDDNVHCRAAAVIQQGRGAPGSASV